MKKCTNNPLLAFIKREEEYIKFLEKEQLRLEKHKASIEKHKDDKYEEVV